MGQAEILTERARASRASNISPGLLQDDHFWKTFVYMFRLTLDGATSSLIPGGEALFPLVLNPIGIKQSSPFAADLTPTQEGGIFTEEQGIVLPELTIEGHTGFRPRAFPRIEGTGANLPSVPLSGQAHFLRLKYRCFGAYSELKSDSELGPRTRLTWHNFKDAEHFIVVPRSFDSTRTSDKRVLYNYMIRLAIVGDATNVLVPVSPDKSILDMFFGDVAFIASQAVARIDGFLNDFEVFLAEVRLVFSPVDLVYTTLAELSQSVSDFTDAATTTINTPYAAIEEIRRDLDLVSRNILNVASIPLDATKMLLDADDALVRLGAIPEAFQEGLEDIQERRREIMQGPGGYSAQALDDAESGIDIAPVRSSSPRKGDRVRKDAGLYDVKPADTYEGSREDTVTQGDTLPSLAAKHLGDANKWRDIADANGLKPPYISENGLPGTLAPGDTIRIPTTRSSRANIDVISKGGVLPGDSYLESILGTDLKVTFTNGKQLDLVVDVTHGSGDFRTVSGVDDVGQALTIRLNTERGTNILYPAVGIPVLVGKKGTVDRVVETEFRVLETVQLDPRIDRVQKLEFEAEEDVVLINVDAVLIDQSQTKLVGPVV